MIFVLSMIVGSSNIYYVVVTQPFIVYSVIFLGILSELVFLLSGLNNRKEVKTNRVYRCFLFCDHYVDFIFLLFSLIDSIVFTLLSRSCFYQLWQNAFNWNCCIFFFFCTVLSLTLLPVAVRLPRGLNWSLVEPFENVRKTIFFYNQISYSRFNRKSNFYRIWK